MNFFLDETGIVFKKSSLREKGSSVDSLIVLRAYLISSGLML